MDISNVIINYRRHLKRRNYSAHTVRNYMNILKQFILWLDVPVEQATRTKFMTYVDFLMDKRLKPKTINCHLGCLRSFYNYLIFVTATMSLWKVSSGYS